MRPALHPLSNNQGSIAMIALIGMMVSAAVLYAAMDFGKISRNAAMYSIEMETKAKIADRIATALEDPNLVNYNLAKHASPDQNANLKACVIGGVPTAVPECSKVSLDFYIPLAGGAETRIVGTVDNPVYTNVYGDDCTRDEAKNDNNTCVYAITSSCDFKCYGDQTSCALTKIMMCSMNIEAIGNGVIRRFILHRKTTVNFTTYALRISNDLKSFSVTH